MKKITLLSILFIVIFSGCATWKGVKKDSSDAWKATKKNEQKRLGMQQKKLQVMLMTQQKRQYTKQQSNKVKRNKMK